jgi:AcrR family transcriptional regulator
MLKTEQKAHFIGNYPYWDNFINISFNKDKFCTFIRFGTYCSLFWGGVVMEKNEEKLHRSVRRTQTALRNSLIELMKTKSILRISAKEIYDAADIGRTTFYAHYRDPYDLLDKIERETIVCFEDMLSKYAVAVNRSNKEVMEMTVMALNYIMDNSNSLRVLLSENGNIVFQKNFVRHFIVRLQKIMQHNSDNPEDAYIHEVYSVFVIHGVIGLMQYWLKNNMHIPIPKMAKMLVKLTQETRG